VRQAPAHDGFNLEGDRTMIQNVGIIDRTLRIVAGLALIGASLSGYIGGWGWLGVIPIATAYIGTCPAYLPFGLSTCERSSARR
jgi:hypothetical protein